MLERFKNCEFCPHKSMYFLHMILRNPETNINHLVFVMGGNVVSVGLEFNF